jgi:PBP1b-binding outer membrane lipoprotein LpoB
MKAIIVVLMILSLLVVGCVPKAAPAPTPTPTTPLAPVAPTPAPETNLLLTLAGDR